jgi:hypothetical protein
MSILAERARLRRKKLESLGVALGVNLEEKDYEYDYGEISDGFRSAPAELADEVEEYKEVQKSAPVERVEGELLKPEEIRMRAEAIRVEFIEAAKGRRGEDRRRLVVEAMEALEELYRESRERGIGGKARAIIEGERRIIEANAQ